MDEETHAEAGAMVAKATAMQNDLINIIFEMARRKEMNRNAIINLIDGCAKL